MYPVFHSHHLDMEAEELEARAAEPTSIANAIGLSKEGLFFMMLPKEMWVSIAEESNAYFRWHRNISPAQLVQRNRRMRDKNPMYRPKSQAQRDKDANTFKEILPHELVNLSGY